MDALIASAGQEVLKLGLIGVALIVLGYWAWSKDRETQRLNEARLAERDVLTRAIMESAAAMREMAAGQERAAEAHKESAEAQRSLAEMIRMNFQSRGRA